MTTLNGLVTNDVSALRPGQGEYAAALTARGKIVADLRILMSDDGLMLDTSARAAEGLRGILGKYVNPRFATQRDISDVTADLAVVGSEAAELVGRAAGLAPDTLRSLAVHHQARGCMDSVEVTVVRGLSLGAAALDVYDILLPREGVERVKAAIVAGGATMAEPAEWDALRVESGTPEWGVDMDDSTLLQEANLEDLHAVSYTKGCYVGQETVARIHFRGHVNRTLRRLNFADGVLPPRGATLSDAEHRNVGEVRSAARSDVEGTIGIGMVRREVADGERLEVRWGGEEGGGGTQAVVLGKARGAIE